MRWRRLDLTTARSGRKRSPRRRRPRKRRPTGRQRPPPDPRSDGSRLGVGSAAWAAGGCPGRRPPTGAWWDRANGYSSLVLLDGRSPTQSRDRGLLVVLDDLGMDLASSGL